MRRCSFAELDHEGSAWNLAAQASEQADPFCCRTEWHFSFHEAFHPERPLHLRTRGDSLVAFAERVDAEFGALLEPVESHWLFGCPLLGPDAVELLGEFLGERQGPDRPSVLVSGLLPGRLLPARLLAAFARQYRILELDRVVLCTASLDGGFDGYLSRRTGRLRRNMRQAARRAAAAGVTFERCAPSTVAAADAAYARMLAVELKSWKGIGECGMAESPSREFYGLMLRRLASSGTGRVVFARCGSDDVGFIFGGMAGATYRGQQFSYAEEQSHISIGGLLQLEQVRWLCEEGAQRYDMGPQLEYKRHWAEKETRIHALVLQP